MAYKVVTSRNERKGKRAELPDEIAKRLKSCSVVGCEDWRDLTSYTTYHCFPTGDKNQDRWDIWTQLLRQARLDEQWIPYRGSLVCSHHFRPGDFVNDPLSKRRKLMKNAIPSVFPEFTVDLEDPSYHLDDDPDPTGDTTGNEESYETHSDETEEYGYINDPNSLLATGLYDEEDIMYQYRRDDEAVASEEEDDIEILNESVETKHIFKNNTASTSRHLPIPIIQTTPQTSKNIRILSTPQITIPPKPVCKAPPPQLIAISANNRKPGQRNSTVVQAEPAATTLQSRFATSSPLKPKPQPTRPLASALTASALHKQTMQEETAKTFSEYNIHPDLQIEIIDPMEDLAACRLRINELEQENKSLKYKYENAIESLKEQYESQILTLRKRFKDQSQGYYVDESLISTKKVRLA